MSLLTLFAVSFLVSAASADEALLAIAPTIEVESVVNKTRGSLIYPFACYSYPTLSTAPLRYWPVGSTQKFELNCWTRSIPSWKAPAGAPWQLSQYDSEIFWFHSEKEDCWFPDYLVQKDAAYAAGVLPWELDLPGPGQAPPGASASIVGSAPAITPIAPGGKSWVPIPPSAPASSPTTLPISPVLRQPIVSIAPPHNMGKGQRPPPEKGQTTPPAKVQPPPAKGVQTPSNPWGGKGSQPKSKGGDPKAPWGRPRGPNWGQAAMNEIWKLTSTGPKPADDLKLKIRYCPQPSFQTGTFKEQYNGQTYCYADTRLDSENKKITLTPAKTVELSCWKMGVLVEEDATWWQLTSEACFVPNQVFDPLTFQGNAGPCR